MFEVHIKCPACGKVSETKSCPRCDSDLSDLFTIKQQAATCLKKARDCLIDGDFKASLDAAQQAWTLDHNPIIAQTACTAAINAQETDTFLRWQGRASSSER